MAIEIVRHQTGTIPKFQYVLGPCSGCSMQYSSNSRRNDTGVPWVCCQSVPLNCVDTFVPYSATAAAKAGPISAPSAPAPKQKKAAAVQAYTAVPIIIRSIATRQYLLTCRHCATMFESMGKNTGNLNAARTDMLPWQHCGSDMTVEDLWTAPAMKAGVVGQAVAVKTFRARYDLSDIKFDEEPKRKATRIADDSEALRKNAERLGLKLW